MYSQKISKIVFLGYLIFLFFGTSSPFQESITDVEDITTSSAFNQVILALLFLVSSIILVGKREMLFSFIRKEKFLTIFLVWCFLSIFWSDYSFVSFKRLFQIITTVNVSLAILLESERSEECLMFFKIVLSAYLILSFLSILFIPGAIDPKHSTWRGLAPSKNMLGQVCIVSIIVWYTGMRSGKFAGKIVSFLMLCLSVLMLIGARSMTSILVVVLLCGIGLLMLIDSLLKPLGIGRAYSFLSIITFVAIVFTIIYVAPDLIISGPAAVGKDITFTGRTDLWVDIFKEAQKHILLGCGFSAFWVIGNPSLMSLYTEYLWLPNEAHLGYLDLLNEIGVVGLLLFFILIIAYFKNLSRLNKSHFGKWFIIATLIINLQESTLFRPNLLTGVLFIWAYLALYADLFHNDTQFVNEKEGDQRVESMT